MLFVCWPDIDECQAVPGLCEGGRCINTAGSFSCQCSGGQVRSQTTNQCVDADECGQPGVCDNGSCVNVQGGYYCTCNPGYIPSPDKQSCMGKLVTLRSQFQKIAIKIRPNLP